MSDEYDAVALLLAREWQQTIAALATDTAENLEIVTAIELKPELKGHPYYWGKMSLLRTLRELADADVRRFETPGALKLLRESKYDINEIQLYTDGPRLYRSIRAQRRRQPDGSSLWVICERNNVLNMDGRWEYEPNPSSRTDTFFERTRFPTLNAAIAFFEAHTQQILESGE